MSIRYYIRPGNLTVTGVEDNLLEELKTRGIQIQDDNSEIQIPEGFCSKWEEGIRGCIEGDLFNWILYVTVDDSIYAVLVLEIHSNEDDEHSIGKFEVVYMCTNNTLEKPRTKGYGRKILTILIDAITNITPIGGSATIFLDDHVPHDKQYYESFGFVENDDEASEWANYKFLVVTHRQSLGVGKNKSKKNKGKKNKSKKNKSKKNKGRKKSKKNK